MTKKATPQQTASKLTPQRIKRITFGNVRTNTDASKRRTVV